MSLLYVLEKMTLVVGMHVINQSNSYINTKYIYDNRNFEDGPLYSLNIQINTFRNAKMYFYLKTLASGFYCKTFM